MSAFSSYFALVKPIKKPDLAKINVTITLGPKLTETAKSYARDLEMSFSELIAILIRKELGSPTMTFQRKEKTDTKQ